MANKSRYIGLIIQLNNDRTLGVFKSAELKRHGPMGLRDRPDERLRRLTCVTYAHEHFDRYNSNLKVEYSPLGGQVVAKAPCLITYCVKLISTTDDVRHSIVVCIAL